MNLVKDYVVVYGGRFQPMHKGHYAVYNTLESKFGSDTVFIATTLGSKQRLAHAVADYGSDPFTFDEKRKIISTLFNIPSKQIVDTLPMRPNADDLNVNPNTTALVMVFSKKDIDRLNSYKNIYQYDKYSNQLEPMSSGKIYYYLVDIKEDNMSATDFRNEIKNATDKQDLITTFIKFFGKDNLKGNTKILKFIVDRIKYGR